MRCGPLFWLLLVDLSATCGLAQRVGVSLEIQPPHPGTTLTLKMNCDVSSNTRQCLRDLLPITVSVKSQDQSKPDEREFREMKYVVTSTADQTLTLKLAQALTLEDIVAVTYGKRQTEGSSAPVLPAAGDVTCCDIQPAGRNSTVKARVPTVAHMELIVVPKKGEPLFVQVPDKHPKGELEIPVPAAIQNGDSVKITTGEGDGRIILASYTYHPADQTPAAARPATGVAPAAPASLAPPPGCEPAPAGSPPAAGFCAAPYIATAPGQVDSVAVVLGCLPTDPEKDLAFCVDNKLQIVKWSLTGVSPLTYTAKLTDKLKPGQSVKVLQRGPLQRDPDSPSQTVLGIVNPPDTVIAVQEGATSVTGFAPGLDKVRVQVVDGSDIKAQQDVAVDSATNQFSATFATPLQADQQLNLYGLSKNVRSDKPKQIEVAPLELDWGRVRAYFIAGVLLSNTSRFNATNANAFLDLHLDKGWFRPVRNLGGGNAFRERFRFHTFFDARLTAIPVTATDTTGSTENPPASPAAEAPATPADSSSGSSTVLSNDQAASLQVGAYFPIVLANWVFKDRPYSLYVAPLVKTGFYTVTSAGSATYQNSITRNRNNDRFFTFEAYGLRLGQYREYHTADGRFARERAPEQLSYIDLTVGRWANFEAIAPFSVITLPSGDTSCTGPAASVAAADCLGRYRPWRFSFEGMFKVPNTPLILGLSANINAERLKDPNYLMPPDDLRFLFGVRFDAGKFATLLGKLGGQ